MFLARSSKAGHSKWLKIPKDIDEINQKLHFIKWEKEWDHLTPKERQKYLVVVDRKARVQQFNATFISQIQ